MFRKHVRVIIHITDSIFCYDYIPSFYCKSHPRIHVYRFLDRKEGKERKIDVREKHWSAASWMCPMGTEDPLTIGNPPGQSLHFKLSWKGSFPQRCHEIHWHRVFHLVLQFTCFECAAYMCNIWVMAALQKNVVFKRKSFAQLLVIK